MPGELRWGVAADCLTKSYKPYLNRFKIKIFILEPTFYKTPRTDIKYGVIYGGRSDTVVNHCCIGVDN